MRHPGSADRNPLGHLEIVRATQAPYPGRGLDQLARTVEARDFAVGAIQAENPLEALDLKAMAERKAQRMIRIKAKEPSWRQCCSRPVGERACAI